MISFLVAAVSMGTVYLFGCLGETLIEKSGNLNLGIPGIMSLGALGGCLGVNLFFKIFPSSNGIGFILIFVAILMACLFAALGGLIYSFLTITLQANQNVTGLVLTTFGVGVMKFIAAKMNMDNFKVASDCIRTLFPWYQKLGGFGELFLSYGLLVYLAIIIAILLHLFLKKTRTGLFLRSVGESPQTADAQGINVAKYKYVSTIIGSAIAGLGGLYYVLDKSGGTTFAEANIEGFGWLAVALVIFSTWRPLLGIAGSYLFGGLYILPVYLSVSNTQMKLVSIIPYLVTVIILVLTSALNSKHSQPPKSLGVNYFREER